MIQIKKMTRILFIVFLAGFIFSSCSINTHPSEMISSESDTPKSNAVGNDGSDSAGDSAHSDEIPDVSASSSSGSVNSQTRPNSGKSAVSSSLAAGSHSSSLPVYPTKIPTTTVNPDKIFFGFYHVDPLLNQNVFEELLDSSYVNCFFLTRGYESRHQIAAGARKVKDHKKNAWLMISEAIFRFYPDRTELIPEWKARVDEIVTLIQSENAWDSILGFYFDEPYLWRITPGDLRNVTMYLQSNYQKRIFICFSIGAVAPSVWTDPERIKQQIDPYTSQYITDVAYDMYSPYDKGLYQSIADEMKKRMGNRTDLKIWYIPSTMNYLGNKDQTYSIRHLNGMLELLEQEENPGGLMCYTYHTYDTNVENLGNIGLDLLLNPSGKQYWPDLGKRIKEIGTIICKGK